MNYASCHTDRKQVSRATGLCQSCWAYRRISHISDVLDVVKTTAGCDDCGYDAEAVALDFDHLPEHGKAFALARCGTRGWPRVWAEVMKCEVVCANCHRVRTRSRYMKGTQ